ncbi:MAG: DoxX family protein [Bacteroidota bacterium]
MKHLIFFTTGEWTGLVLRMTAGLIMLPHGLQKSFGLFGGFGFKASMEYFTGTMRLPWIISLMVVVIETLGPLGLIFGVFARIWALALIIVMIGAIITTTAKNGLFMNWYGTQNGEGFEYHLLFIGICVAILFCGSGRFSVDEIMK